MSGAYPQTQGGLNPHCLDLQGGKWSAGIDRQEVTFNDVE